MTEMCSSRRGKARLATIVPLAAILLSASSASAQSPPPLGSAQSFAVLGGSTVTNTGATVVTGDLGVSPGIAVTGFPPGIVVGTLHAADAVALQAQADLTAAYNNLAGQASTSLKSGQDLGGQTLVAGVYTFDSSGPAAQLTGDLTLDAQGNASAVFIFQIASALTTAADSNVHLINGAQPCNVFWQVGSSATLGARTTFVGTVLALVTVTLGTGVNVSGSVLARNGAATLDNNTVSGCAPPVEPSNQPPVADAGPNQVVGFGSLATLDGSASSDDGLLQPLSYTWVVDTDPGFSATGQVATVSLPVGTHFFTLTVYDGELSDTSSVTITVLEVTPPAIAIAVPVADAGYALDQVVLAAYTCTDASGITSCTGTAADGAPIDTASAGVKTFCVAAVDGADNTANQCVSYSVLGPPADVTAPAIAIAAPVADAAYALNQMVVASYACSDASAITSCLGPVESGAAIDTSSLGARTFCVAAVDGAGNTANQCVAYSVFEPPVGGSPLGSAQRFAVLGASIVTNTGPTILTGDLGVSPGTVITGFPPGTMVGTIHAGDTVAAQAQADAGIAYTGFRALTCNTHLTGQDLGAVGPLAPGVYCFDTSAQLTGTLSLAGAGPWIFQTGSTLTTAGNAAVSFDAGTTCGGANVFWQVGTSATLGVGTAFAGTILAGASVTVMTGATVAGRVLALTGAVTLDSNTVSVCAPPAAPANQPPVAAAGPDQVVPFGSVVTLDGSASTDDGQLQALSYAWLSDTGFSATGQVATVSLPVGTHFFTLTVDDGEFSPTDSVTITVTDATAPAIAIAAPVADAAYAVNQIVLASYTCTDASGIASCTGTAATNAPIDTASAGPNTFCVTAVDSAGNTGTQCASYSVLEPPSITVTSPIEPIYELGSLLFAAYSCGDATTCTGDVASGSPLDTSTPGLKSFTITATDAAGNTTTQLITYTVSLGMCVMPPAGLTAWMPGDGSGVETVTGGPAIWTGVETYAAGKVGQTFSVGNGNYVSLPFEQAGPFTVQAWLRTPDRLLPEFTGVLSTGGSAQSATSLQIELDGTGNYRLNVGDGALSWLLGPALDVFQHVSVTFDGSIVAAYLNGQLVQSAVWAGSPGLGFHVLNVGIDRESSHPFTGLVDDVQVFNRALSGDEVAQSFLAGAFGLCDNGPAVGGSPLGSAQRFAVLGAASITNTGATTVTGDLGLQEPAVTALTGFPPGVLVGTIHHADSVAAQAQADARIAYSQLKALACDTHLTGQDLSAVGPLAPGVYCFDTSAQLTGTLFLTGTGPWLFQIGSTLTTAGNVVVVDAGSTCSGANVFWQVGTSATLGVGTTFAGTILALASVTVMTGANVSGSVLALNGAVTLDNNAVSVCAPPPANQSPVADAGPDHVVPFASLATLDGSASSDDGQLQPLSYSWVSDTGFSATGQVATVPLPLGAHVFTLTVNDGELSDTDAVTITVMDAAAPTIHIVSPVADAAYALEQIVLASYTCADASGIASCTGPVASDAAIDTASPGAKTFCVTAVDGALNTATQCVSYSVLEPPIIMVISPIEPIYELGSLHVASYSCGGPETTCTGDVASGSPLDTSTPGLKSFTITATDAAGNTTTQLVTYTVSSGSCVMPFTGLTAWLPGDGNAVQTVTGTSAPAVWTGVETYAAGKVGQGFSVGNGNYLSVPFEQAGPFTLQAWLRTRTNDRGLPEFTGVISTGGSAEIATSLQIELDGTGNYRLNAGDSTLSSLIGPALDFFQHVAVTFDGSTLTTYLNGQRVQSDVWAGSPGLAFQVLNVGIDREGSHPFTGLVDEVQVFNRALSDAEVAESFMAGASGLCLNGPPVAMAVSAPNPAEATGPDGAIVTLDGTGSSDPDLDTLTCTWQEGATPLGTGCLLSTQLAIGSHTITLTVDDGEGMTATTDVVGVVHDTTGPVLTAPAVVFAEATGPLGAIVFYTASATDVVTGAAPIACAPAAGSGFAIGTTVVTCSATDATGNSSSITFNVIVRDTIAPEVQITSSADAQLSGSTFTVVAQASDIVGVATVTVNGIEATRTAGTAQAGTWVATVPVTLPVAPGDVRRFEVRATDAAGNAGTATLLVDNDGIPAAMDRNRVSGVDESGIYSNDFVHGPTAGTLTRNGWTIRLSSAPTPGGVRATISGSGSIARISACTGAAKEVRLDVIGETADVTCASTGTITVKAISAVLQIELREQLTTGAWQQFHLRTGQSMSVGSPATASTQNLAPIDVYLLEIDGDGQDTVVGSYQLLPGASVDVSASPRGRGRNGQIRFKVLRGSVPVTVSGRMRTLRAGQGTTMQIERTLPIRRLPAR